MRGGSRLFRLERRFRYISSYGIIEAPEGLITDGASVPRALWSVFDPFGEYFKAAVIHDFLYSPANILWDRWDSDAVFKEAMFNTGMPWHRREIIYRAVRMFGAPSFKGRPEP